MANRPYKIDYSKRTVDLLVLKTITAPGAEATVTPDVAGTPMMVSGIEKLVQRYTMIFLTQIGSVKNASSRGTEFMISLSSGKIYDESSLKAEAERANYKTKTQILAEDKALETSDDEALDDSSIVDLKLDRASRSVSVKVRLTTVAGDTFTYITPIPTGI